MKSELGRKVNMGCKDDNYDYSLDQYWPDIDLTIGEMELIDQLSRIREDFYEIILELGARTADA